MSDIPRARALLVEALMLLDREKPVRKTAPKSQKMTEKIAEKIRLHSLVFPEHSHQEIADIFNVNPGRVSEALSGKKWAAS